MDKYTIAEESYKNGYNQALIDRVGKGWIVQLPLSLEFMCRDCGTIFERSKINNIEKFKYCPFCGKAHVIDCAFKEVIFK